MLSCYSFSTVRNELSTLPASAFSPLAHISSHCSLILSTTSSVSQFPTKSPITSFNGPIPSLSYLTSLWHMCGPIPLSSAWSLNVGVTWLHPFSFHSLLGTSLMVSATTCILMSLRLYVLPWPLSLSCLFSFPLNMSLWVPHRNLISHDHSWSHPHIALSSWIPSPWWVSKPIILLL